jgi:hypothetical protein
VTVKGLLEYVDVVGVEINVLEDMHEAAIAEYETCDRAGAAITSDH